MSLIVLVSGWEKMKDLLSLIWSKVSGARRSRSGGFQGLPTSAEESRGFFDEDEEDN